MKSNKKKILVVSYGLDVGGIERSLIGLLNAFDYDRYEVDLFLFSHDGEFMDMIDPYVNLLPAQDVMQYIKKPTIQVFKSGHFRLGLIRLWAKFIALSIEKITHKPSSLMARVHRMADKYFADLNKHYDLALGFFGPFDYLINHTKAVKKIGWVHTDYKEVLVDNTFELKNWMQLDYIAAVSEECKNSFISVFPSLKEKIIVIENIIQPDLVRQQAEMLDVSDEMPKLEKGFNICTVGRYCNAKAFDWAIDACEELVKLGYQIKWYAIGYGPDEKKLKKMVADKNISEHFIFLGKKPNPYPYIKACDIYVQPSRYEGKAVSVREAQILGKPVLITNYPTAKSQLDNGVDGYVCDLNTEGVVKGIQYLLNNASYRDNLSLSLKNKDYENHQEIEKIYGLIK